jgi:hypothetical protein
MAPPPNLKDRDELAAYRRELQSVARPLRYTGVMFALIGVGLALARRSWFPQLPSIIPIAAISLGALNMLAGIVARTHYHRARMRGD